ncbi:MAG TPA: TonB family protein [Terriglobales bacterium]|nr:TonB family protein [Terriglobales bacterium]
MRCSSQLSKLAILAASFSAHITQAQLPPPQTARQALIEMFFSEAPGHFEKHLPDITRRALGKLGEENGERVSGIFSALSMQAKAGGARVETFDAGPTLFKSKGLPGRVDDEIEITVERDDLVGGEDQIELALHMTKGEKEEKLFARILRFTFVMKMESDIWRLNEVDATARFPIADPSFLKALEEDRARQNEQMSLLATRSIVSAEKLYQRARGSYACKLSDLGGSKAGGSGNSMRGAYLGTYLYDQQLATGKKNGYAFSISDCEPTHYRIGAEPEAQDLGQHAYCSDESGTVRQSSDGKAATCFTSGEIVQDLVQAIQDKSAATGTLQAPPATKGWTAPGSSPSAQRVRTCQGVAAGLIVAKVQPIYPPSAREARIQGRVTLKAQISETGDVTSLELISGHPLLAPAAIDAVKQWKYRPYLLNGAAVAVETQVTVNFTLMEN